MAPRTWKAAAVRAMATERYECLSDGTCCTAFEIKPIRGNHFRLALVCSLRPISGRSEVEGAFTRSKGPKSRARARVFLQQRSDSCIEF